MGNGATNPNTDSGMLPATSSSNPYVITSIGELFEYGGGPAWKAFDQVPAIGDASSGSPSDSEYINAGSPGDSGSPDYIVNPMKRGVMVDLGEGNEKCFDKFTFAKCAYTENSFLPSRIIIQGSNSVGTSSVTDEIGDENWDTLFKSFIQANYTVDPEVGSTTLVDPEPDVVYGSWRPEYFCWLNTTAYRYYRVMFGCTEAAITYQAENYTPWTDNEEWEYSNSAAVSELRFIEEAGVPEGSEVIFVPEIVTDLAFEPAHRIYRDGITLPAIVINATVSSNVYSQYLGIDEHTVLMLHFDGENSGTTIIDSSGYENVITRGGISEPFYQYYPILIKGFPEYDLPGFDACCSFPSSYSPSLSVADASYFDLGLSNTPFCLDFWAHLSTGDNIRNEEESYLVRVGTAFNTWGSAAGMMYNLYRLLNKGISFKWNDGSGSCHSLAWDGAEQTATATWFHVAVTYDGTTTRLFINGVLRDSATGGYYKPTNCTTTVLGTPYIPAHATGNGMKLNEFRVSNGVARWVTDFTVPDVPYIEVSGGREIIVPTITVTNIPSVKVVVTSPPLTIPEIESTVSLTIAEVQPPGWSIFPLDIPSTLELTVVQNIILSPVIITTNSLTLKIIEVVDVIVIPEIIVEEDVLIANCLVGSSIRVPDIVVSTTLFIEYNPSWHLVVGLGPFTQIPLIYDATPDLKCILTQYSSFDGARGTVSTFKLSCDFGETWQTITHPVTGRIDIVIKIASDDASVLLWESRILGSQSQSNEVYISRDFGSTWERTGFYGLYGHYLNTLTGLSSNSSGSVLYSAGTNDTNTIRSLDFGETWELYTFDSSYFEDGSVIWPSTWEEIFPNPSTISGAIMSKDGNVFIAHCHYYEHNSAKDPHYDPEDESPLFIDHGVGFIISKDGGDTWDLPITSLDTEITPAIRWISTDGSVMIVSGTKAVFHPENANLNPAFHYSYLYTIYMSTDTGATWDVISPPVSVTTTTLVPGYASYSRDAEWMLFPSDNAEVLLAVITGDNSCYISVDYGATWVKHFPAGLPYWGSPSYNFSLTNCRVSKDGTRIFVYANYTGQLLELQLCNSYWRSLNPKGLYDLRSPFSTTATSFEQFDTNSDGSQIFAGNGIKLFHSEQYGELSWIDDTLMLGNNNVCMSDDGTHRVVITFSSDSQYAMWHSYDSGETWGSRTDSSSRLDVSPYVNSSEYTGFLRGGLSGDGLVFVSGIEDIKLSYTGSTKIATDGTRLFVYRAGAWHSPLTAGDWAIGINSTGDILVAGEYDGRLYKSIDYGANWTEMQPAGAVDLAWHDCDISDDGSVILAVTAIQNNSALEDWVPEDVIPGRVFLSTDSGETWSEPVFNPKFSDSEHPLNPLYPYWFDDWATCKVSSEGTVLYISGVGGLWVNRVIPSVEITLARTIPQIEVLELFECSNLGEVAVFGVSDTFYARDTVACMLTIPIQDGFSFSDVVTARLGLLLLEYLHVIARHTVNWAGTKTVVSDMRIFDNAQSRLYLSLPETLALSDAITTECLILFLENLGFTDIATAIGRFNVTVTELLDAWDTIRLDFLHNLSDVLGITDDIVVHLYASVLESLDLTELASAIGRLGKTATDTINIQETIIISFMQALSDVLSITDNAVAQLCILVLDAIGLTGLVSTIGRFGVAATDTLNTQDAINLSSLKGISDELSMVDAVSVLALLFHAIIDAVILTESALGNLNSTYPVDESIMLSDTVASQGMLFNTTYDTLKLNLTVEIEGDVWECYVLNTPKFLPSIYTGFSFNSYCVFENRAYGAKSDGIYELTGDTDNGTAFHTGIQLSETKFGIPNQKRFRKAYLGVSGTTPMMVMETEAGVSKTYTIDSDGEVDASRALKSKKWKLSVVDFETLDFIKLIPVVLSK